MMIFHLQLALEMYTNFNELPKKYDNSINNLALEMFANFI